MGHGVPGMLRPRIFLKFRHYKGGRSSVKCTGRLYPRRNSWYSLSEAESNSGHMVLSGVPRVTLPGIDPETVRLVAQRLNHYATPGPTETHIISKSQPRISTQTGTFPLHYTNNPTFPSQCPSHKYSRVVKLQHLLSLHIHAHSTSADSHKIKFCIK